VALFCDTDTTPSYARWEAACAYVGASLNLFYQAPSRVLRALSGFAYSCPKGLLERLCIGIKKVYGLLVTAR